MRSALLLTLLGAMVLPAPARALQVQIVFDPTHPDSSGPFSTAEKQVVNEAARAWEAWLPGPGVVNVTVVRSARPAAQGLLGLATAYQTTGGSRAGLLVGTPTGGTVLLSDSAPWFVDATPGEDAEFVAQVLSPIRGLPPSFLTSAPGGAASGRYDLLSVALHELGHVLGIASAYERFNLSVQPSPDTPQQVFVFGSAATLGDPVLHYLAGHFTHGGVYLPQTDENPEEAGSVAGVPSHLDVNNLGGASAGLFPLDLMNAGIQLGERRHISFVDLDILADAFGYAVVPEPATLWLLAGGLLALRKLGARRR